MRCVIARFPFDLIKSEVEEAMMNIDPEPVTGDSVLINHRSYPVKQVGEIITRQDRRDFTAGEVTRALSRLGFTCRSVPAFTPAPALSPLEAASAMLGTPDAVDLDRLG
ncbi:SCO5918 family protein [Streptomyces inhibens]|uniref:SCO5918 family protein n=1 Tax=Streptomyces inhibens TaxID=2293571 RepID=UPI00402AD834